MRWSTIHLEPTEVPAGLRLGLNNRQAILKHELPEDELHKRLLRVVAGRRGSDYRSGAHIRRESARRRRTSITLAGIALVLIAVGTWWFIMRDVAPGGTALRSVDEQRTEVLHQESSTKAPLPCCLSST